MNNYHIYEEEAKGKYSVIFKARRKKKLDFVAIKRLQKTRKLKVYNQAKILSDLNHTNIVKFYDFVQTKNHMWEITEYCPGGDLLRIIEYDKQLPEITVRNFILEIMAGMQYAHSKGVVICDIKPACILVNEYGNVKLGDFGSAQKLVDLLGKNKGKKKGTPSYMAPQLFQVSGVYSFQSDLWALGCIMYELGQGSPPFVSTNFQEIAELARTAPTPKIDYFSSDFNNLLCRLLEKDPINRIKWKQIVSHPWIKNELPQIQIPEQSHFTQYIKDRSRAKVEHLRVSHNFENQNYGGPGQNLTASNRRQVFEFQNYNQNQKQVDDNEYYEQQEKMNLNENNIENIEVNMKKKKNQQIQKQSENQRNQQTTQNVKKQQTTNQIQDSSNINSFLETLTSKPSIPIEEAINHQSDTAVKPIIGNKDIEVIQSVNFNKNQLGFSYIEPEILAEGIVNHQVDEELKKILDGMKGEEKINVLGYFETIVQNSEVANQLFKSNYIPYYMSLLKSYKQSALRAKICEVLGLLIRHATSIQSDILKYGIITGFVEAVTKDKSEKVRRKAMAALGELLFYGATQVDQDALEWDISLSLISTLLKILKNPNEDELVRIYCCKSIQNITAQAQRVGLNFSQIDTLLVMISCFNSTKNQGFKSSIMCSIHHMITLNQTLREIFLEKMQMASFLQTFSDSETSPKTIQILLWIFLQQFLKNTKSKNSKNLLQNKQLSRAILSQMQSSSSIAKGRVYLYVYFMLGYDFRKINILSESRLFHAIERHGKDTGKYQSQALQFVVSILYENFQLILKLCVEELQNFMMNSLNPPQKNNYIIIISQMQNCHIFQELFFNQQNVFFLLNLMNSIEPKNANKSQTSSQRPYIEHFKNHYFLILEKIFTNDSITEKLQEFYCNSVLPFLIGKLLKTSHNQIRYSCIKYMIYIINFCLSEDFLYDSTILTSTSSKISSLIVNHLIPQLDVLLGEGEVVANMMFKLMAEIFRNRTAFITKFWQSCDIQKLLPYYGENSTINLLKSIEQLFALKHKGPLQQKLKKVIEKFWERTIQLLSMYKNSAQELFFEYPLAILANIVSNHFTFSPDQSEIDTIFQLSVILQSHEDVLVRSKAQKLIETLLSKKIFSGKGLQDWRNLSKKGIQNYQLFTKISGLKANIKPTEAKEMRGQKQSRYNN